MRILHVISGIDATAGGTASALLGMAAAQSAAGLRVTVASSYATAAPAPDDSLRVAGVKVEQIGPARTPLARHPLIVPTLRRLVADADVVHVHALWEEIQHQAARIAHATAVPYVITP